MQAGKVELLQRLLPELKARGDRVLLFSQFTQVLDILEIVLGSMGACDPRWCSINRTMLRRLSAAGMQYLKLTGSTPVGERQGLVDEFTENEDITVFLLSTRAGGLGLNLMAANTVIIYDQDFVCHRRCCILQPTVTLTPFCFRIRTTIDKLRIVPGGLVSIARRRFEGLGVDFAVLQVNVATSASLNLLRVTR
jgi:hypothetical protein